MNRYRLFIIVGLFFSTNIYGMKESFSPDWGISEPNLQFFLYMVYHHSVTNSSNLPLKLDYDPIKIINKELGLKKTITLGFLWGYASYFIQENNRFRVTDEQLDFDQEKESKEIPLSAAINRILYRKDKKLLYDVMNTFEKSFVDSQKVSFKELRKKEKEEQQNIEEITQKADRYLDELNNIYFFNNSGSQEKLNEYEKDFFSTLRKKKSDNKEEVPKEEIKEQTKKIDTDLKNNIIEILSTNYISHGKKLAKIIDTDFDMLYRKLFEESDANEMSTEDSSCSDDSLTVCSKNFFSDGEDNSGCLERFFRNETV